MTKKTKPAAAKTAPAAKSTATSKGAKLLQSVAKGKPAVTAVTAPVEEVKPSAPVDDGGPNEKFPFGIQFTTASGFSYERFKDAKTRDKRLSVVGKSDKVCAVKYTPPGGAPLAKPAPVVPESAQIIEGAPGSGDKKPKGPTLVKGAASESNVSKRVTPGARIDEWRIARSVRVGQPGFFLQGGHYERPDHTGRFTVGEEEYFRDLRKAKEAKVAKLPPSDDPVEVKTDKKKVN